MTLPPLLAITLFCAAQAETPVVTLRTLLTDMTRFETVARFPDPPYTCRMESSYDRRSKAPTDPAGWFANTDNLDQPSDAWKVETRQGRQEWVLLNVAGPGCVVRFWSGGSPPIGTVRFYLDGAEEPALAGKLGDLLGGKSIVPVPLAIENAGGAVNLYLPIPYTRGCKITYEQAGGKPGARPPGRWYNIEYRTYPAGTRVQTFSLAEWKVQRPLVEETCKRLLSAKVEGGPPATQTLTIEPGKELSRDLVNGPAAIRQLEVRLDGVPPERLEQALRSTVLVARFDGEETVWCPLGDFFGSGVGVNELKSWNRTVERDGTMTCRWVMPFQKTARLSLLNLGKDRVKATLRTVVSDWQWDDRSMLFHATWRSQVPLPTRPISDWNYVTVKGRGVYVGDTLAVINPVAVWWGEGDEKVRVDGAPFPGHFGTGSEDYYGYAWGADRVFQGPFCNQPRVGGRNLGHTTNTRTRSLDAIPFTRSLQFDMEVWHWADCKVGYSAATYWYARPGARCNRGPAAKEAAEPIPDAVPVLRGAIECEEMKVLARSPDLQIARQDAYPFEKGQWSRGGQLFVQARESGAYVVLLVAEGLKKPQKVVLHGTRSFDYGVLQFTVNGRRLLDKQFDGYAEKPALSGPIELGVFEPSDGRIVLHVEVVASNPKSKKPKYYFGLDAVVLTPP